MMLKNKISVKGDVHNNTEKLVRYMPTFSWIFVFVFEGWFLSRKEKNKHLWNRDVNVEREILEREKYKGYLPKAAVFAIDDAASTAAFFCGAADNSDNSDGYEGRSGSREDEESGFLFFCKRIFRDLCHADLS
jgi:hypothetical protein